MDLAAQLFVGGHEVLGEVYALNHAVAESFSVNAVEHFMLGCRLILVDCDHFDSFLLTLLRWRA